jgi:hypothetical protein
VVTEAIARPRDIIYDVLANDVEVMTSTKFLHIMTRLPRAGTGQSATPQAFYTSAESPTEAGKLKPTIVVLDSGDNPSPNGAAHKGFVGFPLVYGYVAVSPVGEAMLATLQRKLHYHFPMDRGSWYPLGTGPGVEMKTLERQLIRDGDEFGFSGRQFAIWRIQATFVRV